MFASLTPPAESAIEPIWEKFGQEDGVSLYRRETPGSSVVAFRGEAEVDASIARISSVLKNLERESEWTEAAVEARTLRHLSQNEGLEYNRTAAPWPFKDRDFVFKSRVTLDHEKKRLTLELRSIEDEQAPERDCCVRAEIVSGHYILTYISPQKTHVEVAIQADPKGNIPKWIVNLFQKNWPLNTLQGLRKQVAKSDVGDYEPFIGIFQR